MYDMNYISENEYDSLKFKPAKLNFYQEPPNSGIAPYFRMVLAEYLKSWAKENKKPDGSSYNIYTDGLKIYTSINIKMQEYAEVAVVEHLAKHQKILDAQFCSGWNPWNTEKGKKILLTACKKTHRWQSLKDQGLDDDEIFKVFISQKTKMQLFSYKGLIDTTLTAYDSIKYYKSFLQVGCMSMETRTGYVRAWVGGVNFDYFKVDHCNIKTKRQVGSLFKPIIYTLAIENGKSLCDLKNSLTKSSGSGAVSAYLVNNAGVPAIIDMSRRLGIKSDLPPYSPIALGAADISLFEMMQVYSVFPNAGYTTIPQFLLSIKDKNGNTIQDFHQQRKRVISDTVAYKMVYMMKGVLDSGTAASLKHRFSLENVQIAGKTGSTNKNTDAWFIGYTPQLITGVWVGCDDPIIHLLYTANGQGATAAMPIFGLFINKVYNDTQLPFNKKQDFFIPSDTTLIINPCGK